MTLSHHQAHGLELPPTPPAPWITISGGKGGVGKTLLSVNLALLLARAGRRVLLCDFDPGLGDVHVHLRVAPEHTLEDVVDGDCDVAAALLPLRPGLALLSGRSGSTALASGDHDYLQRALAVVDAAARQHDADLVLCDTGAGIGPSVLAAGRRARITLAVTTADPAAVTDAYALLKLFDLQGIATPRLVINRVLSRDAAMRTATRLGEVCRRFLGHGIDTAGWLHDDRELARSVREQRPYAEDGAGRAIEDLRALAAGLLAELPPRRRSIRQAGAPLRSNPPIDARAQTVETLRRLARPR